jgi:hypothetical protein
MIKPRILFRTNLRICFTFLVSCFLISSGKVHGQQKDFQFWPSVKVNVEVVRNLKLHLEEEIRFRENSTLISREINDIGASYRLNNYMKVGIFYRLEADWKNADEYAWRNGIYSDLSLRYEINRFTIGYRIRVQSSRVEINSNEANLFNAIRHRHKLGVAYNIKGIPLSPFAEFELFANTGKNNQALSDYRTWIGLDFRVKKFHTFSLQYGIDKELYAVNPLTAYILAFGYSLDLSLVKSVE